MSNNYHLLWQRKTKIKSSQEFIMVLNGGIQESNIPTITNGNRPPKSGINQNRLRTSWPVVKTCLNQHRLVQLQFNQCQTAERLMVYIYMFIYYI